MYTWGRKLRFTAVSATVVLALTGFSSSRGHGGSSHHGSGGGCSNSSQDHDSSSVSGIDDSVGSDPYGDDDPYDGSSSSGAYDLGASTGGSDGGTYRSRPGSRSTPTASSGGRAQALKDGTAELIECASMDDPYATVEVRNPNESRGLFTVKVNFLDEHGLSLVDSSDQVSVPAMDKATVRVPVAGSGRVDEIDHCEVEPRATADE
ncbi:hypothetical protein ABZV65_22650 [Streptomyces bauhiniae]|uniref:hypothetical protein n=1 Tax=Streptomyces bauhiniae TaxID=2340725 RepID=UPI0033BB0D8C